MTNEPHQDRTEREDDAPPKTGPANRESVVEQPARDRQPSSESQGSEIETDRADHAGITPSSSDQSRS